jgi:hypothetical protein
MIVTICHDTEFQYSALYRSHLPKLAVEAAGVDPGSDEMRKILNDRDAAALAWRGWPRKSAVMILVSVVLYAFSIVIGSTSLGYNEDGNESLLYIALRVITLGIGVIGASLFFYGNISWRRWRYTFTSTEGCLWVFFSLVYTTAGLVAGSKSTTPLSTAMGTVYAACGFVGWLLFESVKKISRIMHITITFSIAITLAAVIYLSLYVWQDDVVLADLNGVNKAGVLTRYSLQRTCAINLLVVMAVSIKNVVKKNLSDNSYFVLVAGYVTRRQILEVETMSDDPDGGIDTVVETCHHQRNTTENLTPAVH